MIDSPGSWKLFYEFLRRCVMQLNLFLVGAVPSVPSFISVPNCVSFCKLNVFADKALYAFHK